MDLDPMLEAVTLTSDKYLLRVWTSPFACALSDAAQGDVIWQMQAVRLLPEGGAWQRADRADLVEAEAGRVALQFVAEDGAIIFAQISLTGDQVRVDLRTDFGGATWLAADLHARPDEHYLGFGERFDSLDQRGKEVDLWVEDGAQGGLTYIPVPFLPVERGLWPAHRHRRPLRGPHGDARRSRGGLDPQRGAGPEPDRPPRPDAQGDPVALHGHRRPARGAASLGIWSVEIARLADGRPGRDPRGRGDSSTSWACRPRSS